MPISISRSGEFVVIKDPGYSIKLKSVLNKVDAESNVAAGGGERVVIKSSGYSIKLKNVSNKVDTESNITVGGDPYTGTYTVIPSSSQQVLDTKFKSLSDDVTVTEIPYIETVNDSDGITVSIAS